MGKRKKEKFQEIKPEMTPMIDVTFLLLIFFIVTLKFKTLEGRLNASLPKDRGTQNTTIEEIEKVDIVIRVGNPGQLVPDPSTKTKSMPEGRLNHYVGRRMIYEVGANSYSDPADVRRFISTFDKDETPVTLDARKGVIYGDVVIMLDIVIAEKFTQVAFAGSVETE
jgi:biopolymer transport protein ExbD